MILLSLGGSVGLGSLEGQRDIARTNLRDVALAAQGGGIGLFVAVMMSNNGASPITRRLGAAGGGRRYFRADGNSASYLRTFGRDRAVGSARAQVLNGGAGDYIVIDGGGSDTLLGRTGADGIVPVANGLSDQIADFELGTDRSDLSG